LSGQLSEHLPTPGIDTCRPKIPDKRKQGLDKRKRDKDNRQTLIKNINLPLQHEVNKGRIF